MATKKKSNARSRISDFKGLKWVMNNLTDDDLAHVDAMSVDPERMYEWLDVLVSDHGMDVSVRWDTYSKCLQVNLVGAWKGFPNEGYAVSARSSLGMLDALKILYWKYAEICHDELATAYEDKSSGPHRG